MKERLIKRVGRIISGSFNAVVDAIENAAPETVMEQALREMKRYRFREKGHPLRDYLVGFWTWHGHPPSEGA